MIIEILWSIVLALHVLCMAYWVGGGLAVWQADKVAERSLSGVQALSLRFQEYSRYYRTLWHIILISVLTGFALAFRLGAQVPLPYHFMTLCWIVMTGLFLWAYFGPLRTLKRALRMQPQTLIQLRRLTLFMVAVGVIALLLGTFGEFI